ncbi:MAG: ribosomal protein bacterial/organelle [Planctomycetota bacterium]|nr:ribosomal protein bacterial/organelle [Planctomycetota bacterium]
MQLHDVHVGVHKHKRPKRIGRGVGSGNGKTAGKGHKGHSSRQGYKQNPLMEGGQMPIIRRVPKRGFNNGAFRKDYATFNIDALERFENDAIVDEKALRAAGIVKGRHDDGVKILGDGTLTKKLTVYAHKFTEGAVKKITEAGGQAIVIA